jgi:hypothetical protein
MNNRAIFSSHLAIKGIKHCGHRYQQQCDLPLCPPFFNESVILELPDKLWNLLQIGVDGYVIGMGEVK